MAGLTPASTRTWRTALARRCESFHIGGWITGAVRVAVDPNHRSSRQLVYQTGRLPQENLAARRNLGAVGSEINGRQMKGRLIRSAAWVFAAETRFERRGRRRRFGRAATCKCSNRELGPKNDFTEPMILSAIRIRDRSPDTNGISFKHRLRPRGLEIIQRCLEILRPARLANMLVHGEFAGDFIGSEHRLERVGDRGASSVVSDSAGVNK